MKRKTWLVIAVTLALLASLLTQGVAFAGLEGSDNDCPPYAITAYNALHEKSGAPDRVIDKIEKTFAADIAYTKAATKVGSGPKN